MKKTKKTKRTIPSEQETIACILKLAREQGVEDKVKQTIYKYQEAIKNVSTEYERKHLAAMGLVEIHKTIGCVGGLIVDGVEVLPPDPTYNKAIDMHKSVVKLD
ncbi:MAG: hypothetical protein WC942_06885 [Clostridia bacterium]|jgi:hypothetical protein